MSLGYQVTYLQCTKLAVVTELWWSCNGNRMENGKDNAMIKNKSKCYLIIVFTVAFVIQLILLLLLYKSKKYILICSAVQFYLCKIFVRLKRRQKDLKFNDIDEKRYVIKL